MANKKASLALAIIAAVAGAVAGITSRLAAGDLKPADAIELGAPGIECVKELDAFADAHKKKVNKATLATFCAALVAAPDKQ